MTKLILITQSTSNNKKRQLFLTVLESHQGPCSQFTTFPKITLEFRQDSWFTAFPRITLESHQDPRSMFFRDSCQRITNIRENYEFTRIIILLNSIQMFFVLLLSLFYLVVKSSKSFVKIGSCFQIAFFFLFYQNFQLPAYSDLPFGYLILPNVPTHPPLPPHPVPPAYQDALVSSKPKSNSQFSEVTTVCSIY